MKKVFFLLFTLAMGCSLMAQGVIVKKGKVRMSEAYYVELKSQADQCEKLKLELANAQAALAREKAEQQVHMVSFEDSASYAIGQDLVNGWNAQHLGINPRIAGQAMIDMANGQFNMPQRTCQSLLQRFQSSFEQRQQAREKAMREGLQDNIAAGQKFLDENKKSKSIYTTPSGLQYKIVKKGNGPQPTANSTVKVHYTGTLIDGTKFDSSVDRGQPITFPLHQVIAGWQEGLQLMPVGSKYILYVPYTLGYGDQIVGEIPPGSALIFEVELLEIVQ